MRRKRSSVSRSGVRMEIHELKNRINDPRVIENLLKAIRKLSDRIGPVRIMHVCGTHEHEIVRFGLRSLLPQEVEIISGPGCPVCVTPKRDIDRAIFLADRCIITTYGDMYRVPSNSGSFEAATSEGNDIRVVYSITDALDIAANEDKEVIHFGIGFETTSPASAAVLIDQPRNFSILSVHRLIPPALSFLLSPGEAKVDALLNPGHVSTIIGTEVYEDISKKFRIPQVVTGFEPADILLGIYMVMKQINEGRCEVENGYKRAIKREGNRKAQKILKEVFYIKDAEWRGFPEILDSGYGIRDKYEEWDALKKFEDELGDFVYEDQGEKGCRCGEVLRGLIKPEECGLFREVCSPSNPVGACMVSSEGACNIAFKFG